MLWNQKKAVSYAFFNTGKKNADVAKDMDVHKNTVARYRSGLRNLDMETGAKLAKALGIRFSELVSLGEDKD